jgi:nicotinamide-nucleotide amidase
MDRKVNIFIKKLQQKKLTVAFAESMTCGMAASKLATCPGTSDVLAGSIVCYSPVVKRGLMKIPERTIEKHSPESKEVTELLVKRLSGLVKADVYGAVTGLAAEGGSERPGKPVGTVFLSVMYKKKVHSERKLFRGTPSEIREKACFSLYRMISDLT